MIDILMLSKVNGNCPQVNAKGPHWWQVNCGSGDGFGAVRQQAITRTNVDPAFCRHMASVGHSKKKQGFTSAAPILESLFLRSCFEIDVNNNDSIDMINPNQLSWTKYQHEWAVEIEGKCSSI